MGKEFINIKRPLEIPTNCPITSLCELAHLPVWYIPSLNEFPDPYPIPRSLYQIYNLTLYSPFQIQELERAVNPDERFLTLRELICCFMSTRYWIFY